MHRTFGLSQIKTMYPTDPALRITDTATIAPRLDEKPARAIFFVHTLPFLHKDNYLCTTEN